MTLTPEQRAAQELAQYMHCLPIEERVKVLAKYGLKEPCPRCGLAKLLEVGHDDDAALLREGAVYLRKKLNLPTPAVESEDPFLPDVWEELDRRTPRPGNVNFRDEPLEPYAGIHWRLTQIWLDFPCSKPTWDRDVEVRQESSVQEEHSVQEVHSDAATVDPPPSSTKRADYDPDQPRGRSLAQRRF